MEGMATTGWAGRCIAVASPFGGVLFVNLLANSKTGADSEVVSELDFTRPKGCGREKTGGKDADVVAEGLTASLSMVAMVSASSSSLALGP